MLLWNIFEVWQGNTFQCNPLAQCFWPVLTFTLLNWKPIPALLHFTCWISPKYWEKLRDQTQCPKMQRQLSKGFFGVLSWLRCFTSIWAWVSKAFSELSETWQEVDLHPWVPTKQWKSGFSCQVQYNQQKEWEQQVVLEEGK